MTDCRGNTARWTVAAFIAPMVACLFTGITVWAEVHNPLLPAAVTTTTLRSSTMNTVAVEDPKITLLRASVATRAAAIRTLAATVSVAQKQAAKLTAHLHDVATSQSGAVTTTGSGSTNSTGNYRGAVSSGSSNGGSSSSGSSQPATMSGATNNSTTTPPPPVVTAPVPAPATQVTTGASGAPK